MIIEKLKFLVIMEILIILLKLDLSVKDSLLRTGVRSPIKKFESKYGVYCRVHRNMILIG